MSYRQKHIHPKIKKLKGRKLIVKSRLFWICLCVVTIIGVGGYGILFYSKFQVAIIEISGNETIKSEDIERFVASEIHRKILSAGILNISSKSIFIVDTTKMASLALHQFPGIEKVEVQKKMPNTMALKITERKAFAEFCERQSDDTDTCFLLDENGIIFELTQGGMQDMIIVRAEGDKEIFAGSNIIEKNMAEAIAKIQKNLKNHFQIDVKEAFVSNPLVFNTSENWKIYFDPTSSIDLQITKMNALLNNEIPVSGRKNLQYIYLQYKDRAYYK